MALLLRRTALFFAIVLSFAFLAAAARAAGREVVALRGYAPGTIVIKTHERRLYYVLDSGRALRFPVGVGRTGMQWHGNAHVEGKYVRPAWAPPPMIRAENPHLPKVIPGGAPNNPMGAAALTLRGGEYAIHGTNRPGSIGGFVSHGCIRMYNSDIRALYAMVSVGTPVVVE
ncbi:MAG TPA: L,D-transpeptidase [Pseudolabrys sp.]|nr:L,D-transpeptidase [Pseudolabrys sp.]